MVPTITGDRDEEEKDEGFGVVTSTDKGQALVKLIHY
jgi:hypothetical protein